MQRHEEFGYSAFLKSKIPAEYQSNPVVIIFLISVGLLGVGGKIGGIRKRNRGSPTSGKRRKLVNAYRVNHNLPSPPFSKKAIILEEPRVAPWLTFSQETG